MFLILIFFYLLACDSIYPFNQFFFYSFFISLHAAISAVKFFLPDCYTLSINKLFLWRGGGGEGRGRLMKNKQRCVIHCYFMFHGMILVTSFRKNWSADNSQIIGKLNLH